MEIKNNEIIEFVAISWDEHHWEFDYPTVVLKPFIAYSPNGNCPETMIEDMGINICCGDDIQNEDVSEEFEWRRWSLSRLKRVVKDRLNGKDTWKTKIREVCIQKLQFYYDDENELQFKIIETKKA